MVQYLEVEPVIDVELCPCLTYQNRNFTFQNWVHLRHSMKILLKLTSAYVFGGSKTDQIADSLRYLPAIRKEDFDFYAFFCAVLLGLPHIVFASFFAPYGLPFYSLFFWCFPLVGIFLCQERNHGDVFNHPFRTRHPVKNFNFKHFCLVYLLTSLLMVFCYYYTSNFVYRILFSVLFPMPILIIFAVSLLVFLLSSVYKYGDPQSNVDQNTLMEA
mmetsp:Transcript_11780/g.12939  ORF Transcript_11780/g.12939 Transcript_11780/m.12939 type:complete len:215 (+) Transcript_11780:21-665(+)